MDRGARWATVRGVAKSRTRLKQLSTHLARNQQEPTVQPREVCFMLCGSLDGRGAWERMDTCICTAESHCCPPETITTMLTSYTPILNKKLKKRTKARP